MYVVGTVDSSVDMKICIFVFVCVYVFATPRIGRPYRVRWGYLPPYTTVYILLSERRSSTEQNQQ